MLSTLITNPSTSHIPLNHHLSPQFFLRFSSASLTERGTEPSKRAARRMKADAPGNTWPRKSVNPSRRPFPRPVVGIKLPGVFPPCFQIEFSNLKLLRKHPDCTSTDWVARKGDKPDRERFLDIFPSFPRCGLVFSSSKTWLVDRRGDIARLSTLPLVCYSPGERTP